MLVGAIVVLAGILGAVGTSGAVPPSSPSSCSVTAAGPGTLQITWPTTPGAADYIVSRRVDNGPTYWRGRTTTLTFTDTDLAATLDYTVVAKSPTGERSTPTPCTDQRTTTPLQPPASCTVTAAGPGTLQITWPTTPGAADYIVSRRVDNGPTYWRGRTTTLTFTDTDLAATLDYTVVAKSPTGERSTPTPCTDQRTTTPLQPPASCTVTAAGPGTLQITWPTTPGAADYIVSRRVDNGPTYWRGRTTTLTFTDTDLAATLDYTVVAKSPTGERSTPTPCTTVVPDPGTIDLVAVGDLVECGGVGGTRVAALLDQVPGRILGLGDYVYQSGSTLEFDTCFDPVFGRHKTRFDPIPGNHDYLTPGAAPYFEYFGAAAGDPTRGYHELVVGNWQILALNTNCSEVGGCTAGSAQGQWLSQRLAAAPAGVCRIATMHHPRRSSYPAYADQPYLDPIHRLLFDAGTDLVLTGHAHHYERLAPITPDGVPDEERGVTNIIVGTGGVPLRGGLSPIPSSQVRITDAWGVLDLDLREHDYSWRFVDVDGRILDFGTETCIASR